LVTEEAAYWVVLPPEVFRVLRSTAPMLKALRSMAYKPPLTMVPLVLNTMAEGPPPP
jgi:hypothetical protein